MPTQGSWRPKVSTCVGAPARSMLALGVRIELVGLMAMRTTKSCPVLMPPSTPPLWLLAKPAGVISSPWWLPRWATTPKPSPISTPFTAFRPIIAKAMSASSRSYSGSPRPGGTPWARTSMRAPQLSPALRRSSM